MATAALISASEYLRSSFEHDAEFVDGHIEERTVGERDHNLLQRKLLLLLSAPATELFILCIPEQRLKIEEECYRVPDLAVLRADAPVEQVVETPPLICIEVLSPADSMSRTLVRVRDMLRMGVAEVWVIDPECRAVYVHAGSSSMAHTSGSLTVPHTPIQIELDEVFSAIQPSVRR
jgi:Uma2 family endonuclease